MTTVIWWIRRDLRLADNQALTAALRNAGRAVPLFVLDPTLLSAPDVSEKRVTFLFGGLRALDADLRARGAGLIVRRGDPVIELTKLVAETGAEAIYAEEDPWPHARRRDDAVAARLPLRLVPGVTIRSADVVRKADGGAYTIFTPFSRAWKALPLPTPRDLLPAPERLPTLSPDFASLPIPEQPALTGAIPLPSGEAEALHRLRAFTAGLRPPIHAYADARNRMAVAGTSQLSPYLRFGMISARQAAVAALTAAAAAPDAAARAGAETWLTELIWREFYMALLYYFPYVLDDAFRADRRDVRWGNDEADFAAWREGRTGYPVVDAAMRQLVQTGWMHNRARMIAASFLVKDLLVDWRWGERFFMQHLLDGDPAANNGGWQWTAGVGADAAPYFRIFNPTLQGAKFDPDGAYIRRWIPELARVPDKYIHQPWMMPAPLQRQTGCIIGHDYPVPRVDHAWARERALVTYRH
ncbi:MAG: deoxyribodipyrimidine photo-lyase [Chloroflexi bacterium]|nr:deoxyribodipyrimidine photo-lyase [Chloroflexota bacterium]